MRSVVSRLDSVEWAWTLDGLKGGFARCTFKRLPPTVVALSGSWDKCVKHLEPLGCWGGCHFRIQGIL